MSKKCDCCGNKMNKLTSVQILDGNICTSCAQISQNCILTSVSNIKKAWEENHSRYQVFNPNMTITDFGSGYVFIDTSNQMCYVSNHKKTQIEPIIFKFTEIDGYRIERVGEKTITKSKGGIGRAVVGGALFGGIGAIVGASTARQETKQVGGISMLYVDLNINGVQTTVSISSPPLKAKDFLESAMSV